MTPSSDMISQRSYISDFLRSACHSFKKKTHTWFVGRTSACTSFYHKEANIFEEQWQSVTRDTCSTFNNQNVSCFSFYLYKFNNSFLNNICIAVILPYFCACKFVY